MEAFAVSVFQVAKPDKWRVLVDSIASGDRADASPAASARVVLLHHSPPEEEDDEAFIHLGISRARAAARIQWARGGE